MSGYLWRGDPSLGQVNQQIMRGREQGHGTEAGWKRHKRAGEDPCRPCSLAAADAARKRLKSRNRRRQQAVDGVVDK